MIKRLRVTKTKLFKNNFENLYKKHIDSWLNVCASWLKDSWGGKK